MKLIKILMMSGLLFSFSRAVADTEVRFTNQELNAAFTLVRPELNSIEVNGRTGVFTPAPALRFFGLGEQRFEINFNAIIDLVDLEFAHLKARVPQIQFNQGSLELTIPLQDQSRVLKSRLGAISIEGVSMVAILDWETQSNGAQRLVIRKTRFNGDMYGTGVLKPQFILGKVRNFLLKILTEQVRLIIEKPMVQESIQNGLLTWAKFYTGVEYHSITPSSIRFFNEAPVSGLSYKVQ